VARGDALRPRRELAARPLEAVVRVAELARGQRRPAHVVLGVGRRDHDRAGPRRPEDVLLGRRQARRVEVLDDLDERGGVEADQALVAVGQRAVDQPGLLLEVAPHDHVALGVRGEPALAATHQLLDLGLVHPVVLVVVEHRAARRGG
jgi:hypothetical protein